MVMHARKLPRITDGFSEKHQAHGYENSKYGNKYRYNNHDKSRDSPSTNSLRSSSPDSHSQSPRYHKGNYFTKVRDKDRDRENRERDRDRDREREYKEYRDREGSRSPKERRRERERERERDHREPRGIHDRINSVHKKEEKERLMRVGDWSEHVSSSGKKYYYNCRTEVSQWEKPPEWLEWERSHRSSGSSAPGGNHSCKESSLSSVGLHRIQHDKNRQDKHSTLGLGDGYRESRDLRESDRERREFRNEDPYERRENRKYAQDVGTTDMDISSGDSTPTSESHHARCSGDGVHDGSISNTGNSHLYSTINQHISSSDHFSRPISKFSNLSNIGPLSTSLASSLPGSGGTVTTLTITNDHHADDLKSSSITSNSLGNSVSSAMSQLLNSHPRLISLSNLSDTKGGIGIATVNSSNSVSYLQDCNILNNRPQLEPLNIATNSINICAGPPTPTHSENQDGIDIRKIGSPNSCLNSLQSLVPSSSNSGSISLTPSLANYYKETLICHVQSWPSEPIEKQCQRLSEEAHTISSIIMTKVSADLKMARSMVRHAEILSMLQEQRILFLRSQKSNLEEMKSQNCFMNDT